jgi:hypothetical protein
LTLEERELIQQREIQNPNSVVDMNAANNELDSKVLNGKGASGMKKRSAKSTKRIDKERITEPPAEIDSADDIPLNSLDEIQNIYDQGVLRNLYAVFFPKPI